MSNYTADDFRTARFAEHPDGRVAERINPKFRPAWATERPGDYTWDWHDDHTMAANGWSPVGESDEIERGER